MYSTHPAAIASFTDSATAGSVDSSFSSGENWVVSTSSGTADSGVTSLAAAVLVSVPAPRVAALAVPTSFKIFRREVLFIFSFVSFPCVGSLAVIDRQVRSGSDE